jgi:hypothetical protein
LSENVEPIIDERRARLNALVDAGAKRFTYVYDFGDHWEHAVRVEEQVPPSPGAAPVLCNAGENACPPEDVGGPPGYFEFRAALKDPLHEQHTELLEWIGRPVDTATIGQRSRHDRQAGDIPNVRRGFKLIFSSARFPRYQRSRMVQRREGRDVSVFGLGLEG